MRRVKQGVSWLLAFFMLVTMIPNMGFGTAEAKTKWQETAITSLQYDVVVDNCGEETSFEWKSQGASWSERTAQVKLAGNGEYSFSLTFDDEKGMKNLGYIPVIGGSAMTVEVSSITVNGSYKMTYADNPVLKAGVENSNGLSNIWNSSPETKICSSEGAYLALDHADGAIMLYVEMEASSTEEESTEEETSTEEESSEEESSEEESSETEESTEETKQEDAQAQEITAISYFFTVKDSADLTSFTWKAQGASWNEKVKEVELNGDGEYEVSFSFDYEEGMKNLGYVMPCADSSMTLTLNKLKINDEYELTYENAPVLQAGVSNANGLSNIWNVQPGVKLCGNDNAYLALDKQDGAILLYELKKSDGKDDKDDTDEASDISINYVKAMGSGWNLGNSFEGFDSDLDKEDTGETAWGNPVVTRELIKSVKAKGYSSIRIPFTVYRRYTVNENAAENEYKYVIREDWLKRYKEVVDWAVEEGLYVMVNMHHDSWIWLKYWNGDTSAEEYRMYTDFWKQIAAYMAEEPEQVCFETINEPDFEESGNLSAQQKLDIINRAAYEIIRDTKGNEKRMMVLPTLWTNHEKCSALLKLMQELDDDYLIATVHYYSEWVYSANLGKTGFDEELWKNSGESYTPRVAAEQMMNILNEKFLSKKIGVVIGEYGLLGYDQSEGCLETGEELKYYEYMNELARNNGVCLVFWDNGSGINRHDANYAWKNPLVGSMLENSMSGRSSYATGLDNLYFKEKTQEDITLPLTLNGNEFKGIKGLTEGKDYTYSADNASVTLKQDYVNQMFEKATGYGVFAELVLEFSQGADWHEYLVKYDVPSVGKSSGTRTEFKIPVEFKGAKVRRITAYQGSTRVGPNSSWWNYLQYDGSFGVDYEKGNISLLSAFFEDASVQDGDMRLDVEFYDGQKLSIELKVQGNQVTGEEAGIKPSVNDQTKPGDTSGGNSGQSQNNNNNQSDNTTNQSSSQPAATTANNTKTQTTVTQKTAELPVNTTQTQIIPETQVAQASAPKTTVKTQKSKAATATIESVETPKTQTMTETESEQEETEETQEAETTVQSTETEETVQEQTFMEEQDVAMAQTTKQTSALPFVAGGIIIVLAGAGAAVFYYRKKSTIE